MACLGKITFAGCVELVMMDGVFQSLVWDNHACMPLRPGDTAFLGLLDGVHEEGVDVVSLNISTAKQSYEFAMAVLETYSDWIAARLDRFLLVKTASDAQLAKSTNRLGICFDIEGADVLESDPANVAHFYDRGVRWMLPVYNTYNGLGSGCMVEDQGLTALGRDVVGEMNRVGMVVCASHCGYRTARDLMEASSAPVIFSHSNPKALCDHPRNIPDELIRACVDQGGVIGVNGFGFFLGNNDASSKRYAEHLLYMIDLAGPEHVGVALDYVFDGAELDAFIESNPDAFPTRYFSTGANMVGHGQLREIFAELQARGLSQGVLANVFGENHLRIARSVWR